MKVHGNTKHGHARNGKETGAYKSWYAMRHRCASPGSGNYHLYGGRGVTVCKRWDKYENFLADMGERPNGYSLDRINVNKGYSPSNCRWAEPKDQSNNRRNNRVLCAFGKSMTVAQWARHIGMRYSGLWMRLDAGWSIKDALLCPPRGRKNV